MINYLVGVLFLAAYKVKGKGLCLYVFDQNIAILLFRTLHKSIAQFQRYVVICLILHHPLKKYFGGFKVAQ